jgi:hypothetical protein
MKLQTAQPYVDAMVEAYPTLATLQEVKPLIA